MSKQITQAQALKLARDYVTMYQRGGRWTVSEYSDAHRAHFESVEADYFRAQQLRKVALARQALEYFFTREEADRLARNGEGTARDIVRRALAQSQK